MLLIFLPSLFAFAPQTPQLSRGTVRPRATVDLALTELAALMPMDGFGSAPMAYAPLPPEMSEFAVEAPRKFSHVLMEAVGAYILLSGACTFFPVVKDRALGGRDPQTQITEFLESVRIHQPHIGSRTRFVDRPAFADASPSARVLIGTREHLWLAQRRPAGAAASSP